MIFKHANSQQPYSYWQKAAARLALIEEIKRAITYVALNFCQILEWEHHGRCCVAAKMTALTLPRWDLM
jgi:hypothetical protein